MIRNTLWVGEKKQEQITNDKKPKLNETLNFVIKIENLQINGKQESDSIR